MLSRRVAFAIWASVAALVVATLAAAHWQVERGRLAAVDEAQERVVRFISGAEASFNRTLISIDLLLADMAAQVAPDGRLDRDAALRALRGVIRRNLEYRDLALLRLDGSVVASALDQTERLGVPLPPEMLRAIAAQPAPMLAISPPVRSFATSQYAIYFARPLKLGDGERLIAVAEMPVTGVTAILGQAAQIPGLEVTLERDDGQLLASVPAVDALMGSVLRTPLPADGAGGDAVQGAGRLDGSPAILAVRTSLYRSVRITAGIPETAAMEDWRDQRSAVIGATSVFIAMLLAAGAATHWLVVRLARARQEIAKSKDIMDQALASMADAFLLCDADDRVVAWNARYLQVFPVVAPLIAVGTRFETLLDAVVKTLPFPNDTDGSQRAAWYQRRLAHRHADGDGGFETELPDGSVIDVIDRRTPDGGTVSVMRDITQSERKLARAKAAAEASSLAKSQFLAAMSHEIRTPLNGVLGMNALLLQTPLTDEQRQYARTIRSSGKALLALINDILDLSRVEAGRLELCIAEFDPYRLLDEVAASLATRAHEKGLALDVRIQPGLPHVLEADEGRLRQVLFNLVGNAVKFTEQGSVTIDVSFESPQSGRVRVSIAVRDTGIGIDPAVVPTLFERFIQADSGIARRYGGSGLGLAISRGLVELMGGRIGVQTEPGRGSTFTLTVELGIGREGSLHAPDSQALVPHDFHNHLRILVAEDNEVNQLVISAMLTRLGHECEIARDGLEAIEKAGENRHDLVLMDIHMPSLDGLSATRRIRALGGRAARVPIVALTANVMRHDLEMCLEAGMNDHVSKPVEVRELTRVIARTLSHEPTPS